VVGVLDDEDEDVENGRDEECDERIEVDGGNDRIGVILVQLLERICCPSHIGG
jgi:hypothetical protein